MKHILKKIGSAGTVVLTAAALTVGSTGFVWAEEATAEVSMEAQVIEYVGGLTESIIGFSDEEIAGYMASDDAFTSSAMQVWDTTKGELGDLTLAEVNKEEAEYEEDAHGYIITVPVKFEKLDADFVYVFEDDMPVSLTVDVKYPMSVTLQKAGLNTIMGIGIVFVMLLFLSFVISLFRFVPMLVEGKKKEEPAPAPAAPVAPAVVEEETDDTELIAVIAAAIAASEGTSPDGLVVRSIRKINRRKW